MRESQLTRKAIRGITLGGLSCLLCLSLTACRSPAHNARVQALQGLAEEIVHYERSFLGRASLVEHVVRTVSSRAPETSEPGRCYWYGPLWLLSFDFKDRDFLKQPFYIHRAGTGRCGVRVAHLGYSDPRGYVGKLLTLHVDKKRVEEHGASSISGLGSFDPRSFANSRLQEIAEDSVRAEDAFWADRSDAAALADRVRRSKPETNTPPPPPRYTLNRFQQADLGPSIFKWKRNRFSVEVEVARVQARPRAGGRAGPALVKVFVRKVTLSVTDKENGLIRRLVILPDRRVLTEFGPTILSAEHGETSS